MRTETIIPTPKFAKCHRILVTAVEEQAELIKSPISGDTFTSYSVQGHIRGAHYGVTCRNAVFVAMTTTDNSGIPVDYEEEGRAKEYTLAELADYDGLIALAIGRITSDQVFLGGYDLYNVTFYRDNIANRWCLVRAGECAAFLTKEALVDSMRGFVEGYDVRDFDDLIKTGTMDAPKSKAQWFKEDVKSAFRKIGSTITGQLQFLKRSYAA
ncbi:MAG: hypothetical protein ACSHWQ_03140 [Spongiibacteraceae bacterium]